MIYMHGSHCIVGIAMAIAAAGMVLMGCSGGDGDQAAPKPEAAAELKTAPEPQPASTQEAKAPEEAKAPAESKTAPESKPAATQEAKKAPAKPTTAPESRPAATQEAKAPAKPVVIIDTSMGVMKVELWPDKAPQTVKNFLRYVDDGFYDGQIFHRVMSRFMVQGGGFAPDMREKSTREPIKNEATTKLHNDRGTIAMARTPGPHTATAQFFINLVDNDMLNHTGKTQRGYGYCPFGNVVEGLAVIDKIATVSVHNVGPLPEVGLRQQLQNVPVEPVVIKSIRRAE